MHVPSLEHMTTAPGEPATQVRGGEKGQGNCPRGLQPSNRLCRIISRHTSANSAHLPPAAAREVRYLQNFLPFPRRQEEEEALEVDDLEVDTRKDNLDDDPVDFLGCY